MEAKTEIICLGRRIDGFERGYDRAVYYVGLLRDGTEAIIHVDSENDLRYQELLGLKEKK